MNNILMPESFPNLPIAVSKMQQLFAQKEINNNQLVELLNHDPLLCANILKIVNSPHYGLSKKISSVNHAVSLLGTTIIRGIVMAAMLKKSFTLNLSPYHITIEQFDQICTLRARFINLWAKDYAIDIQSVASAAFLMESGKIIISNIIAQNNYTTRFEELLLTNSIEDAEKLLFNVDSYTIAGMLFREWEFEEGFIEMIMGVSHPKTLEQQLLHVSSVLISTDGILTDVNIKKALLLLNRYELLHKNFSDTVLELQKKSD